MHTYSRSCTSSLSFGCRQVPSDRSTESVLKQKTSHIECKFTVQSIDRCNCSAQLINSTSFLTIQIHWLLPLMLYVMSQAYAFHVPLTHPHPHPHTHMDAHTHTHTHTHGCTHTHTHTHTHMDAHTHTHTHATALCRGPTVSPHSAAPALSVVRP